MERIKELRISRGFTQKGLADALNVSRSTVAMWETGKSQPDNLALNKLADLLTTTCDYLLGRTDEAENKKTPVGTTLDNLSLLDREIIDLSLSLPDSLKNDVLRYIKFLHSTVAEK